MIRMLDISCLCQDAAAFSRRIGVLLASAMLVFLCGCINAYTRFPWSEPRIEETYQCTHQAAVLTFVASFPQVMDDGRQGFMWGNCLTIPFLGVPCAVDTVLEACVDTVCLPVDMFIADSRQEGMTAWGPYVAGEDE